MKLELTQALIETTAPQAQDVIVWDTRVKGLFLKITPKGKRSYGLYYRRGDKQLRPKLGDVREITLEQARQMAGELLLQARREKLGLNQ